MSKLSFSRINRYLMCGYSHHLHYNKKLRPNVTSAALLVGSSLDEAINELLRTKIPEAKDLKDPYSVFLDSWEHGFINGKKEELKYNTRIVYADSDLDFEILEDSDLEELNDFMVENMEFSGDPASTLAQVRENKKNKYKKWSEIENVYYNLVCWLSWKRKAKYIIDAYAEEVLPKIKKVVDVQKQIEMKNEDGDEVTGFIDLIAEWEDGKTYILDNKSAKRAYDDDAPFTKPQLHLYAVAENNNNVGFIVYLKDLDKNKVKVCRKCNNTAEGRHKTCNELIEGKRCHGEFNETIDPKGKIQILLGQTNPILENMVLENINDVNKMVKNNLYVKNLNACDNWYGGKCPYYNYCHKGSEDGLEQG